MSRAYLFAPQVFAEEQRNLKRFTIASVALHIAAVASIVIAGSMLDLAPKIEFEAVEARLVRFGEKPRDKKLLPRIVKEQTAPAPVKGPANTLTEKEKEKPKQEKKDLQKKEPEKRTEEPKKPASLDSLLGSALDDIKKDARAEVSKEGSPDGVPGGDVTDPALAMKGNLYIRQVSALIRRNWRIPSLITPEELPTLKAELFFRITPEGEIYDLRIVTPSGNRHFDTSVLEAVKLTTTIPLPDDKKLKKYVLTEGLQWQFTSSTL